MDATKQPERSLQEQLDSILEAEPDVIDFCGKKVNIHWMHKGTVRKFTHIMLNDKGETDKRSIKLCACILLNSKWKILFLYWIYWRWLYYVKDLDQVEVLKVLDASKKKMQYDASLMNTTLSIGMMDTMMTMTKREVGLIQAERRGEQPTA